jgi:WD40 repeat protein
MPCNARRFIALLVALSVVSTARAQVTTRVSVDSNGNEGDDGSFWFGSISADGRFVAFASLAGNLVSGDGNPYYDVFVRDRLNGTTERVSVDSAGNAGRGDSLWSSISADGRFVVFQSVAPNLVANDNNNQSDVFVHDRQGGSTECMSVTPSGATGAFRSEYASISADGRFVSFSSAAYDLVAGDTNSASDAFVRDRQAGTTERVSVDSTGAEANGSSDYVTALSADGNLVAFSSSASNLAPGDTNNLEDVFVRDRQAGTTERVSVDSNGNEGSDRSMWPSVSADGRYVAFYSGAYLGGHDNNLYDDVYVRDRQNQVTTLMSVDDAGKVGNYESYGASISANGRYVAFISKASNLVPGDTNGWHDAFLRDRLLSTTTRVSVDSSGAQGNGETYGVAISADGRFFVFESDSSNLVPNDANSRIDVFVRGPDLTIEADPLAPPAGATLTFSTWSGEAAGAAMLTVRAINGAPLFLPVVFGAFDSAEKWLLSATVPPGLAGNVIEFQTFGIVPTGKVDVSNRVDVSFQ